MSKKAKKPREIALKPLETEGLMSLGAKAQAAQVALNKAVADLALAHGQQPAKHSYQLSADGTKLILIDEV